MNTKLLDTVLLLALPASGKSEVRKYMDGLTAEECIKDMHMGPTLQLDDYPYVHFMHRIDDELLRRGHPYIFYKGPERPFCDPFEWGTLIELLNEDYDDLLNRRVHEVASASQALFDRLDRARARVGLPMALGEVSYRVRMEVAQAMETETRAHLAEKNTVSLQDKQGKTVIIEMARGGANGAAFPLTPPSGYQYSLSQLSKDILDRASILYVWVDPEESRRKNYERAHPDGQSSILHHGVPLEVMLGDYGCDDMEWLINRSDRENTIRLEKILEEKDDNNNRVYVNRRWHLPVARFDNRKDLTTFIRKDRKDWQENEIAALKGGLSGALTTLAQLSR